MTCRTPIRPLPAAAALAIALLLTSGNASSTPIVESLVAPSLDSNTRLDEYVVHHGAVDSLLDHHVGVSTILGFWEVTWDVLAFQAAPGDPHVDEIQAATFTVRHLAGPSHPAMGPVHGFNPIGPPGGGPVFESNTTPGTHTFTHAITGTPGAHGLYSTWFEFDVVVSDVAPSCTPTACNQIVDWELRVRSELTQAVPEPAASGLLGLGLLGAGIARFVRWPRSSR